MIRNLLSLISATIAFGCFIPYGRDILRGQARPARSTRLMFALLLVLTLLQQHSVGNRLSLALTLGESVGALGILAFALWKGVGGLRRLDVVCYILLATDILIWRTTHNSLVGLHLTIVADQIAIWPTLVKTWRDPTSETPLFFIAGSVAPLFAIAAEKNLSYGIVLFPLYITVINATMVLLIYRPKLMPGGVILTK
ncbi:MAG TPA: hypothetical protein VM124_03890 [Candidatus Limnocylindrales bacterium]|nr:hypothetical protein [Candidatus Limnocylindrales bacterium]